ncbi:DUF58 domain-containing protein [Phycicoccus sp. 3266]|uniref:DUF58 domain-containing protein n=1 Tax=Phycicoccus sp. 3266 TaxID=2817751 RepID=UPI0028557351|nr:DUF58 domain-containing protein [Phycicoccus sp. 3266]MDR6861858.1 uncharacterized protein (DUF58 family) [Phycicoccus sp. 3266]
MSRPVGRRLQARWQATPAHVRATLLGFLLLATGVLLRRPDAVALAAPLVVVAVWALAVRPARSPEVHAGVRHTVLREGQSTAWTTTVQPAPGVEDVGVVLLPTPHTSYTPVGRAQGAALTPDGEPVRLDLVCQSTRWGHRSLGPATIAVGSAFGGFTWEPEPVSSEPVSTVPLPDHFTARAQVPHPDGLVGRSRSAHLGDGGELADIRPFRFGDRLRRVHWPVSVRTGTLHVTATHADQDSEILLLVDAMHDLGRSSGPGGTSSSLDNAARAAGAIAEHYLRTGDRVGLLVLGARDLPRVQAAAGNNHLRRLLDVLSRVRVADSTVSDEKRLRGQLRHHVGAGTLVVVLTPAVSVQVLAHAVSLARRGVAVVAIDTLPADFARPDLPDDRLAELTSVQDHPVGARLAWRIRLLEREREMLRARDAGVPIVPWTGPRTLDLVLRDLGRRSRAPRVVSR